MRVLGLFWEVFQGCSGGVLDLFWWYSGEIPPEYHQNSFRTPAEHARNTPQNTPKTPSEHRPPNPQVSVPGEHIGVIVLGVHIWRAAIIPPNSVDTAPWIVGGMRTKSAASRDHKHNLFVENCTGGTPEQVAPVNVSTRHIGLWDDTVGGAFWSFS